MTGPPCLVCGEPTAEGELPHRCAYCGEPVCADHRLPENHECTGERLRSDESPKDRGPEPMDIGTAKTLGTTPDDVGQPSPDVTIDGKVAGEERAEEQSETPWWRQLLPW